MSKSSIYAIDLNFWPGTERLSVHVYRRTPAGDISASAYVGASVHSLRRVRNLLAGGTWTRVPDTGYIYKSKRFQEPTP